ncbi:thiopurine S-methyltransferase [Saccharospirillum mangrovi]|uniref:thiopurine S-methyltransferase n=1 Tax=Saccharospirillum mangrovi TaxID=2161747 RepID=UPI000D3BDF7E|nr:thiopurine S-methyltransferase [Saccharospirillum mangrovi]
MEASFWHDRWQSNRIAFHLDEANPLLVHYFSHLQQPLGCRVFVPLCGKTRDIGWLLTQGYRVVGAELVESAIVQLFADLGVEPEVVEHGPLKHFHARDVDIWVGDVLELTPALLGEVDAVYDRAALVALPEHMRAGYAHQLMTLAPAVPQLLISYVYDQDQVPGPPFSVSDSEVLRHYDAAYQCLALARHDVNGGLRGQVPAEEVLWLLRPEANI